MIKKLHVLLFFVTTFTFAQTQRTIENPPNNLEVCDTDNDGFATFDLTQNDAVVIGSQDLGDVTVGYFETQANADANISVISNPSFYTNISANSQPMFVRVDELPTGTFDIATFDIIVLDSPTAIGPNTIELCDDDTDEIAIFDLTSQDNIITGGDATLTVSYYVTQNDLDNNLAIPNPSAYANVINPQTIYALVSSANNCTSQTTIDLVVNSLPTPAMSNTLEACDDDSDGFATFDLNDAVADIANGEPNVTISFHLTQADADANILALSPIYTNTLPFTQTIYARDTNDITGCFTVVTLELIVNVTIAATPTDISICDDNGDTFEVFDLTQNDSVVTGSQDPADMTITYHESQADLNNGIPIASPMAYTNTANPQTIYMNVTNASTTCTAEANFVIEVDDCTLDDDGDGVSNDDEDLNGNGNLDDDDTDGDMIPNYLDDDDDGDLVPTQDEIEGIGAGRIAFIDTDMDTIENYLDDDDDGDLVLTKDEDYNGNGDPIDDDTNNNTIPDFLDEDVALSVTDYTQVEVSMYPNPVQNRFTIESNIAFAKAELVNLHGQVVYLLETPLQLQSQLDVSTISSGVYFVRLDGQMVGRLLKE